MWTVHGSALGLQGSARTSDAWHTLGPSHLTQYVPLVHSHDRSRDILCALVYQHLSAVHKVGGVCTRGLLESALGSSALGYNGVTLVHYKTESALWDG